MARAAEHELVVGNVGIDELLLDPKNPRLADFGLKRNPSQKEIISALWSEMAVDELYYPSRKTVSTATNRYTRRANAASCV